MSRTNPVFMLGMPALVAATWLAACTRPDPAAPAPASAAPAPAAEAPAPTVPPPASEETPPPPGDAPAGPAQPSPDAPAPDESPAPKPAATEDGPPLESMRLASTNAKLGVAVDLRYSFDGNVLNLAAVPRAAGSNLRISVQHAPGLEFSEGSLSIQKAAQAGIYRKQLAVTRLATGPSQIRVLVTMGVGEGSSHGFFTIPLDSVKQH